MINETLRSLVVLHGVNQVLADLADICKQEAEEDPMMVAQWLRTARKILKLSLELPDL
jgi:hypothetical protein